MRKYELTATVVPPPVERHAPVHTGPGVGFHGLAHALVTVVAAAVKLARLHVHVDVDRLSGREKENENTSSGLLLLFLIQFNVGFTEVVEKVQGNQSSFLKS